MSQQNLPSWHGEDFERDWGFLDVDSKVVLDLGADYGSTAAFFLSKGAAKVICVESYAPDYAALAELSLREPRVTAIEKHLVSAKDFELLIAACQPQVVKVDVEGAEAYLLFVPTRVLRRVEQFGIELHNLANAIQCHNPRPPPLEGVNDLQPDFEKLFERIGFAVEAMHKGNWVLNCTRKAKSA